MNAIPSLRWLVLFLALLTLAGESRGQASGSSLFGSLLGTDTHLLDPNGTIVHTWPSTYVAGVAVYLLEDGSLLRSIQTPGGPFIGGLGGGVQRLALDGAVLWDFRYDGPAHWSHHDLEPMPNGNVLMIAYDTKTVVEAINAGRDPTLLPTPVMRVDSVIEVQPTGPTTGTIVWEWHLWDHLIQQFDPTKANYGVISAHPELMDINYPPIGSQADDYNHMNSVKYDPVFDRIMVSAHRQGEIWVIDHSTTTAQAAGHTGGVWGKGGDILYRYGNPVAYGAGTPADRKFFGQHSARFIPPGYPGAGNYTVFNNYPPIGGSAVWEYTPPMDALGNFLLTPGSAYGPPGPIWTYSAPGFSSALISSAERLQNGNTLICSGYQNGWIFEVTPAGQTVFSYIYGNIVFHAHYVDRKLWSDKLSLSVASGGTVTFDVIAGTPFAGQIYLLLGSASGTTPGIPINGLNFPLNPDNMMVFTFEHANTPLLAKTVGTLSPFGRTTAMLNIPPMVVASPLLFHFAGLIINTAPLSVVGTTNAVPLTILP